MSLNEFAIIEQYFHRSRGARGDVRLGVGDDCAIVAPPAGHDVLIGVDTLVEGRHFQPATAAADLGYKALAVNLSDLAAMGAEPAWATLALTVPRADEGWLRQFAAGFFALADRYGVALIGGDTTRGPLSVTVQVLGFAPNGEALTRSGAVPGDRVLVTGTLGDAALALRLLQGSIARTARPADASWLLARLNRPTPRVEVGQAMRSHASAAIDVSDGFAQDLLHILRRSGVGAHVDVDRLPLSDPLRRAVTKNDALALALSGGDDYELCLTAAPARLRSLFEAAERVGIPMVDVGVITPQHGLSLVRADGSPHAAPVSGYDHFR